MPHGEIYDAHRGRSLFPYCRGRADVGFGDGRSTCGPLSWLDLAARNLSHADQYPDRHLVQKIRGPSNDRETSELPISIYGVSLSQTHAAIVKRPHDFDP